MITLKAIWLALLDGDLRSVFKLCNLKRNWDFIRAVNTLFYENTKNER